ncbi:C-X-C motif chemokine 19 [Thalassophryne amazonica]|uniref:C-X-C motif chemokine 19 n=1 Tax=Thalassophryne amazonica TaxID=390379 RepID=UPI00147106A1|nr:C-X-C motif chemokine 19 [Thalassophryne amazonica]
MKLCILLIFGTLFVLVKGMPPISRDYNTHCHCLQVESRIIPPDRMRSIKLVSEGPHCPHKEVIAGLTNGKKICLNPRSPWVKQLIHFIFNSNQQGAALPKKQP